MFYHNKTLSLSITDILLDLDQSCTASSVYKHWLSCAIMIPFVMKMHQYFIKTKMINWLEPFWTQSIMLFCLDPKEQLAIQSYPLK